MKLLYSWLQDFLQLQESPNLIAERLTATGLEVERVGTPAHLQDERLVLGTVKRIRPHPTEGYLSVAEVSIRPRLGVQAADFSAHLVSIASGAPGLEPGRRVIVALPGALIRSFSGEKLRVPNQIIGTQLGEGVLCSPYDLGLAEQRDDLLYPESTLPDGTSAAAALAGKDDRVLEIGLTPNRGDAASHYGTARELGILLNRKVRYPQSSPIPKATADVASTYVHVSNTEACPRYCGLRLSEVRVGPSPSWLQRRLQAIGLLPINNVVDITNYVTQAVGQPLHAFDWKEIEGDRIYVQLAEKASLFRTLDGKERQVAVGDLLICDARQPVALAGIIGGSYSAVSEKTRELFLESAYFSASRIARTSRRLGIQTEASFRYARGIDPERVYEALCWAAQLLKQYASAKPASYAYDLYPKPLPEATVWCRWEKLKEMAGRRLPLPKVERILKALDIEILQKERSRWRLRLPPYRSDLLREVDVFEEILRIYGYDKLEGEMRINYSPRQHLPAASQLAEEAACDQLVAEGFFEIITNPLLTSETPHCVEDAEQRVYILDSNSEAERFLRTSLLPSGLEVLAYNLRHKQEQLRLFELGSAYWRSSNGSCSEEKRLALYLCGKRSEQPWIEDTELNFYDLSAVLERLFTRIGFGKLRSRPTKHPYFAHGLEWHFREQLLATGGKLRPEYVSATTYAAEIYWSVLCNQLPTLPLLCYKSIPRTPEVHRDLALVLDRDLLYAEVQQAIEELSGDLVQSVRLQSVYRGKSLPLDKKSYALSFVLQAERTLSEQEIAATMQQLQKTFEEKLGAHIRIPSS